MKGCKKKTAFIRNEDAEWIDDYLINAGQSDNFGMVVRNAVSEYVQKKKQARAAAYFKFIGEENCKALEEYAIKNGTDLGFFYNLEWILRANNLLYGPCYANKAPTKTNPKGYVYFDKHTLKAIDLIHRIIQNPTAMSKIKKNYSKKEL